MTELKSGDKVVVLAEVSQPNGKVTMSDAHTGELKEVDPCVGIQFANRWGLMSGPFSKNIVKPDPTPILQSLVSGARADGASIGLGTVCHFCGRQPYTTSEPHDEGCPILKATAWLEVR